jgi:hypothetical protein
VLAGFYGEAEAVQGEARAALDADVF